MSASKTTSQLNAEDRRNKLIAVAAGVLMLGVFYYVWTDSGAPSPAAPAPVAAVAPSAPVVKTAMAPGTAAGVPAKTIGSTAGALDPTLHMQAMLVTEAVTYTGSGRNIFAGPGQVDDMAPIPKVLTPVRTGPVAAVAPVYHAPVPQGPPPIDLKFFGMVTSSSGSRQAMLLHGDDVFLASRGDIVQRKYRVVDIGPNSIQVEDMSNNNRQTLPLQATP